MNYRGNIIRGLQNQHRFRVSRAHRNIPIPSKSGLYFLPENIAFHLCNWRGKFLRKFIVLLIVVLCGQQGIAQVSKIPSGQPTGLYAIKGDYFYEHRRFQEAIYYYHQSLKVRPEDAHTMLRMAEVYAYAGVSEMTLSWYNKALSTDPGIEAEYILKYVFAFNASKMYDDALKWLSVYQERLKAELPGGYFKDTTIYLIRGLEFLNSGKSDISPFVYKDRLIFHSNRSDSYDSGYHLYEATLSPAGQYKSIRPLNDSLNTTVGKGQVGVAGKQGELFFTSNDLTKDVRGGQMYFSDIPKNRHDKIKIEPVSFKDFDRPVSHPTVNAEGNTMYFVSDNSAEGNGMDIFRTEGKGGKWSTPELLDQHINTKGDELYPFLHNDSILYFASDGHSGFGGLDIFKVNVREKDAGVENLGAFLNTSSDDFGFFLNENAEEGFISSNRPGGEGGNDIYGLHAVNLKIRKENVDTADRDISKQVTISLYTSGGDEIRMMGNANENIEFSISPGIKYILFIDKVNYNDVPANTNIDTDYFPNEEVSEGIDLKVNNEYNFLIKKFVETGIDWRGLRLNPLLKNLKANPGDLITFRFIPGSTQQSETNVIPNDTRITFNKDAVSVSRKDTLVLGYVVEEAPKTPADDKPDLLAKAQPGDNESLPMEAADTTSLAGLSPANGDRVNDTPDKDGTTDIGTGPGDTVALPESDYEEDMQLSDTSPQPEESVTVAEEVSNDGKDEGDNLRDKQESNTGQVLTVAGVEALDHRSSDTTTASLQMVSNEEEIKKDEMMPGHPDDTFQPSDTTPQEEGLATVTNISKENQDGDNPADSHEINLKEVLEETETKADQSGDTLAEDLQMISNGEEVNAGEMQASSLEETMQGSDTTSQPEESVAIAEAASYDGNDEGDNVRDKQESNTGQVLTVAGAEALDHLSSDTTTASLQMASNEEEVNANKVMLSPAVDTFQPSDTIPQEEGLTTITGVSSESLNGDDQWDSHNVNLEEVLEETEANADEIQASPLEEAIQKSNSPTQSEGSVTLMEDAARVDKEESLSEGKNINPEGLLEETNAETVADQLADTITSDLQVASKDEDVNTDEMLTSPSEETMQRSVITPQLKESVELEDNARVDKVDSLSEGLNDNPEGGLAEANDETGMLPITTVQPDEVATTSENVAKDEKDVADNQNDSRDMSQEEALATADTEIIDDLSTGILAADLQMTTTNEEPFSTSIGPATVENEEQLDTRYRVQIAASRVELTDAELRKIYKGDRNISQFIIDDYFKYYIAEEPSYALARKIRNECGVHDAFIVKITSELGDENLSSRLDNNNVELSAREGSETTDYPAANTHLEAVYGDISQGGNVKASENDLISTNSPDDIINPSHIAVPQRETTTLNENVSNVNGNMDSVPGNNLNIDTGEVPTLANAETISQLSIGTPEVNLQAASNVIDADLTSIDETSGKSEEGPDIQYRVQIAASRVALEEPNLEKIYRGQRKIERFKEESYFKYYIAEEPSYFTARKILKESGVVNAFIVAYMGKEKWGLEEAIYTQYKEGMIKSGLEEAGTILKITIVNFEFDEFILLPDEKSKLRELVIDKLKTDEKLYAIVNGHTDIRGSDTYNFGLSEERAMFVREFIINEGVEPERVETHYFGESRLAKYCHEHDDCDETVHQANRRVEVILLTP